MYQYTLFTARPLIFLLLGYLVRSHSESYVPYSRYVEIYRKLYQYNHDSVIRLLNDTTNLVVFLAQHSNYVSQHVAEIGADMMDTVTTRLEVSRAQPSFKAEANWSLDFIRFSL